MSLPSPYARWGFVLELRVAHRPINAQIEVVRLPEQRPLLDPARYLHWSGRGAVGYAQLGEVATVKRTLISLVENRRQHI